MPRLLLHNKEDAFLLFDNYTKRNSVAAYVQSHGAIGTKIIETVYNTNIKIGPDGLKSALIDPKPSNNLELNKTNATFWLYTTVREELLPLSYYNNMIEAMVMSDIFNWLFKKLDP